MLGAQNDALADILGDKEHPIDQVVPISVVIIGAGISGITAAILLKHKVPGIQLRILDRHAEVGGVWHANVYPGVRCDVPSDVYQSSFLPSMNWSQNYAEGAEIKEYWQFLVKVYNLQECITCNVNVDSATWHDESAKWIIDVNVSGVGKAIEADFIINATGLFSQPHLPNIAGLKTYQGVSMHSAEWDQSFDPAGKRIAVIGNGASGLQLVPALQKVAQSVDHYARSGAWIIPSYGGENLDRQNRQQVPSNAREYLAYRKNLEAHFFKSFGVLLKNGQRNENVRCAMTKFVHDSLHDRQDLEAALVPSFPPGCRQSTPATDYLLAIKASNVRYIRQAIERLTSTGIKCEDGTEHTYDAIIFCTGWRLDKYPTFPVLVRGTNLQESWSKGGTPGHIDTYMGMAAPGVPNFFFILGPNSAGFAGTVPNVVENQATYIARILRKVSSQGIRTIEPTREATNDFRAYCEAFFPRTVLSEDCRSWYSGGQEGGRIIGLWPGSATHANIARRDVRFEDYEYTHHSASGNRFAWLGDGRSARDVAADSQELPYDIDYTPHLKQEAFHGNVDLKAMHELWYEV